MYTIFRNFLRQYSRRLLSILAQPFNIKTKNKSDVVTALWFNWFLCSYIYALLNEFYKRAKRKKKCGAHTHVHHLSQLSHQYSRRLLSILAQLII